MSRRRYDLDGRTAFISGAASGIGRALALRLAAHGCPLAIIDQDEEGLRVTADLASEVPVLARRVDVRDRQAQMALAAEVAEWAPAGAPVGYVFNNAGVTATQGIAEGSVEDDDWVLDVNLGGVVNGVRAFLPVLQREGTGVIVNTSSVFGLVGIPFQSAYCASKFAVRGLTESLRHELRGTGLHAVAVHPGGIKTNIVRNARHHGHPLRGEISHEEMIRDFDAMAFTPPARAAKIIHEGVKAGRSRILVGPDAYVFDALSRLAPTHYYDVLERLETLTSRRR